MASALLFRSREDILTKTLPGGRRNITGRVSEGGLIALSVSVEDFDTIL